MPVSDMRLHGTPPLSSWWNCMTNETDSYAGSKSVAMGRPKPCYTNETEGLHQLDKERTTQN
jgi:hypothetical protein